MRASEKTGTVLEDGLERLLTGCKKTCTQDDVMRGELDVLYEGAGKLKCSRCEVI